MTRAVDGQVIVGAECADCGRRFPTFAVAMRHGVETHGWEAMSDTPRLLWAPAQPDLFDLLEGEARNN